LQLHKVGTPLLDRCAFVGGTRTAELGVVYGGLNDVAVVEVFAGDEGEVFVVGEEHFLEVGTILGGASDVLVAPIV